MAKFFLLFLSLVVVGKCCNYEKLDKIDQLMGKSDSIYSHIPATVHLITLNISQLISTIMISNNLFFFAERFFNLVEEKKYKYEAALLAHELMNYNEVDFPDQIARAEAVAGNPGFLNAKSR